MTETETAYKQIIANLQKNYPEIKDSKMFGMPTFKYQGKAGGGTFGDTMVFKLAGAELEQALAIPGAKHFDPMGGRPMKAWVQVPLAQKAEWPRLAEAAMRLLL